VPEELVVTAGAEEVQENTAETGLSEVCLHRSRQGLLCLLKSVFLSFAFIPPPTTGRREKTYSRTRGRSARTRMRGEEGKKRKKVEGDYGGSYLMAEQAIEEILA
jgi:hypothetical protein